MEITYSRPDLRRLMLDDANILEAEIMFEQWNSDGSLTVEARVNDHLPSHEDVRGILAEP